MGNLNAEQVKKAHEHCSTKVICKGCPCWFEDKKCTLRENTLAIINSQEQRIERLEKLCKLREQDHNDALDLLYREEEKNKKLTEERDTFRECAYNFQKYVKSFAENQAQGYEPSAAKAVAEMEMWRVIALEKKALTEENEAKDETITNLLATIADIQADTVRKMQERLKAEMRNTAKYSFSGREYSVIVEALIDQIAKEMLEGTDDNT